MQTNNKGVTQVQASYVGAVPHSTDMGQELLQTGSGELWLRQPFREQLLGDVDGGLIHTAVQISLMDSIFGAVVIADIGYRESIATLDLRIDYLRPAVRDCDLYASATIERKTRQIVFVSGKIWQSDPENPTAIGRASFMRGANTRPAVAPEFAHG